MFARCNVDQEYYRICDREGFGPGPCQDDIEFKWEPDDSFLEDIFDPETFDSPEDYQKWLKEPHEIWCLIAIDKRTGKSVDSLGGIIDPGKEFAEEEQEIMLSTFPKHPLKPCSGSSPWIIVQKQI